MSGALGRVKRALLKIPTRQHSCGIMITGITLQAHPTREQKVVLSQWIGCSRFVWNAKCEQDRYLCSFAGRYMPIGTYPSLNAQYSHFKNRELSPWLYECPSQILRNAASSWYFSYKNFLKGQCGKPKKKRKGEAGSVLLTRELFRFEKCEDGVSRLFIGTKKNNIGYLSIKNHAAYGEASSIRIKKVRGHYLVSFCYEDGLSESDLPTQKEHLEHLKQLGREKLEIATIGIDRGVAIPVQAGNESYDFTQEQKRKKQTRARYIRRCQRRLSKQSKGSKRRNRTKRRISKSHGKIANIRKDFCHKTSRAIVDAQDTKIIVLEDLKTSQMTRAPRPKKDEKNGQWLKNNAKNKAGLNRSILDKGWHQLEIFLAYKSFRAGKALFKVPAHYTSQECGHCGYTHPDNRKSQERFLCDCCGHSDNADRNAAEVIKKRAIELILDSGTELSDRGVLLDKGRGAAYKTGRAKLGSARSKEASKKKGMALVA